MARLKILFIASECVPYSKTGGLADVCGALPQALAARGHDVRIIIPRYRVSKRFAAELVPGELHVPVGSGNAIGGVYETKLGGARVYLLEHDNLFDRAGIYGDSNGDFGDNLARFTFLNRGALEVCKALQFYPDVIHVHDWPTCLVPIYLNTVEAGGPLARAATVLTIHNMGYQGWFSKDDLWVTGLGWGQFHDRGLEKFDRLNLLKGGIYASTMVSTVSPKYAQEIQTEEGGEGLDGVLRDRGNDVIGILNGIDDAVWNPEVDTLIAAPFTVSDMSGKAACKAALQAEVGLPVRPDVPLIGLISRLVHQKGIDVFAGALTWALDFDAQFVVLGSGESWAEDLFSRLSAKSDRFRAYMGYNDALAHKIEAGADLFAMPSRYEPCGLNQLYSQRYGTLPIVRGVGGLDDTVESEVTGFKFYDLTPESLAQTMAYAIHVYRDRPLHFLHMQERAMRKPMGWTHASRQYEACYRLAMARRLWG